MNNDFCTDHLTGDQLRIAKAILDVLPKGASGGGCTAFYTPKAWAERGETYGLNSKLILCHDGGDLARFCNYDYMDYAAIDRLSARLAEIGCYVECCTSWYSAVYDN